MPLKAVLFDMDGVLVDTEPLHSKAYHQTFKDLKISVPNSLYTSFTGNSTKNVCETLIKEYGLTQSVEEISKMKRTYFKYFFDNDTDFDLLPGALDLIKHYKYHGIKLILASSASMNTIHWVFEKFGLSSYFDGTISGGDLKESKPNPEIFLKAAEIANEPTENCMVVEDSTNGIIAAHAAKIFCAAYKSEHSLAQDYSLANILVNEFKDLEIHHLKKYFN